MAEANGSTNLEEVLIAVPNDHTAGVARAKASFINNGNFDGWNGWGDLSESKDALVQNAWDLVRRSLLYESGFYLSNAITQHLGDEQLANTMGGDKIDSEKREQLDLFRRKIWQLAIQDDYTKAHQFVQRAYDHVKDIVKLPIKDSGLGSYLFNLGQLLNEISPEKGIRRSGDFAFNEFSIKYRISEDGFPFIDPKNNVDNRSLFYPVVLYINIQSTGLLYARGLIDAFKKGHITHPEDSVTHFSGRSVREVLKE